MAAYEARLEQGRSEEEGTNYLRDLFRNVSVQDKSARESLQTFLGGKLAGRTETPPPSVQRTITFCKPNVKCL